MWHVIGQDVVVHVVAVDSPLSPPPAPPPPPPHTPMWVKAYSLFWYEQKFTAWAAQTPGVPPPPSPPSPPPPFSEANSLALKFYWIALYAHDLTEGERTNTHTHTHLARKKHLKTYRVKSMWSVVKCWSHGVYQNGGGTLSTIILPPCTIKSA